ncbi:MAG TPA: hypothetical protein VJA86_03140 [Candidatus Nanoarchaeia archaeon]|nr:hypothetical protein [Candidatus Nanoarchaeia archaeon]
MPVKTKKSERGVKSREQEESELEKEVEEKDESPDEEKEESEAESSSEDDEQKKSESESGIIEIGVIREAERAVEEIEEAPSESFSPIKAIDIAAPVISNAGTASAQQLEQEVAETPASSERREQAARTPMQNYVAGGYEKNYWVGGAEKRETNIDMGIIPVRQRKDVREMAEADSTRRIDFSEWQRGMESSDIRSGRRTAPTAEEYMIDVRTEREETRLPFERREDKRKYRP